MQRGNAQHAALTSSRLWPLLFLQSTTPGVLHSTPRTMLLIAAFLLGKHFLRFPIGARIVFTSLLFIFYFWYGWVGRKWLTRKMRGGNIVTQGNTPSIRGALLSHYCRTHVLTNEWILPNLQILRSWGCRPSTSGSPGNSKILSCRPSSTCFLGHGRSLNYRPSTLRCHKMRRRLWSRPPTNVAQKMPRSQNCHMLALAAWSLPCLSYRQDPLPIINASLLYHIEQAFSKLPRIKQAR